MKRSIHQEQALIILRKLREFRTAQIKPLLRIARALTGCPARDRRQAMQALHHFAEV